MATKTFKDFDVGRVQVDPKLNKTVSCRITVEEFDWLKKNNISPTKLFRYCLMEISKNWKKKDKK